MSKFRMWIKYSELELCMIYGDSKEVIEKLFGLFVKIKIFIAFPEIMMFKKYEILNIMMFKKYEMVYSDRLRSSLSNNECKE